MSTIQRALCNHNPRVMDAAAYLFSRFSWPTVILMIHLVVSWRYAWCHHIAVLHNNHVKRIKNGYIVRFTWWWTKQIIVPASQPVRERQVLCLFYCELAWGAFWRGDGHQEVSVFSRRIDFAISTCLFGGIRTQTFRVAVLDETDITRDIWRLFSCARRFGLKEIHAASYTIGRKTFKLPRAKHKQKEATLLWGTVQVDSHHHYNLDLGCRLCKQNKLIQHQPYRQQSQLRCRMFLVCFKRTVCGFSGSWALWALFANGFGTVSCRVVFGYRPNMANCSFLFSIYIYIIYKHFKTHKDQWIY